MGPSGFLLSIIMVAVCHKTQHQIKSRENKRWREGVQAKSTQKTDAVFLKRWESIWMCEELVLSLSDWRHLLGYILTKNIPLNDWLFVYSSKTAMSSFLVLSICMIRWCRSSDKAEVSDGSKRLVAKLFSKPSRLTCSGIWRAVSRICHALTINSFHLDYCQLLSVFIKELIWPIKVMKNKGANSRH